MSARPRGSAAYRREPDGQDRAWQEQAACRDVNPDLFFEESPEFVAAALEVCAGCPVRSTCLEFAIGTHQDDGVWGGLVAGDRATLRRRRQAAAARLHPSDVEALRMLVADRVLSVEQAAEKFGTTIHGAAQIVAGVRRADAPGPVLPAEQLTFA